MRFFVTTIATDQDWEGTAVTRGGLAQCRLSTELKLEAVRRGPRLRSSFQATSQKVKVWPQKSALRRSRLQQNFLTSYEC